MSRLAMTKDILLRTNSLANTSDADWSLLNFFENFQIKIIRLEGNEIEFDLIGINAPIANALRRILISEIPTMAFEKVMIYNNSSILQDEILAHRLGLIPIKADPSLFEYRDNKDDVTGSAQDTLEFELKIKCLDNSNNERDSYLPEDMYVNHNVYSKHIKWIPIDGQFFKDDVGPIYPDILIAKMRPGQEIDIKLLAFKGIGEDHAKFSPVATASYRLMPTIKLLKKIEGENAILLQESFPLGVIEIEEVDGIKRAKVKNSRYDNGSRNCFRYEEKFENAVQITRERHHFIFSIESIGAIKPEILFVEALKNLKEKCKMYLEDLNKN